MNVLLRVIGMGHIAPDPRPGGYEPMTERLQKVLAAAGFGSRRACEEMILAGRISVNGRWVRSLPVLVDPDTDHFCVDGRRVHLERKVYYVLNKPKGVLCTQSDPARRTRAVDLLAGVRERVYPVGRLDADSQGLLLMTNDGELAARLTHPRYGVPKTYRARVGGRISPGLIEKLREGIWLSGGKTRPAQVKLVYESKEHSILEITLHEGRNRQVRRMLARLGHPVRELTRVRIGRLELKGLGPGQFRPLRPVEVAELRSLAARAAERAPKASPPQRRRKSERHPPEGVA
jgi:23S rRNA pseudouridine2605 synthase